MFLKKIRPVLLLLLLGASFSLSSEDYQAILRKVDGLASYNDSDFAAEYTIVEDKPGRSGARPWPSSSAGTGRKSMPSS